MTSKSRLSSPAIAANNDYGFARVRDIAFDAVRKLWRRREAEGMKQTDLAEKLGKDPAWVSRKLSAPGNWTLRTIGEFVQALDGEAEIEIFALEDDLRMRSNFDAYSVFKGRAMTPIVQSIEIEEQFADASLSAKRAEITAKNKVVARELEFQS